MSESRHILLLRHGQTDANASGVIQGHRPTPLNPLGHQQAQRLARRLATFTPRIDYLVTSDLPRAAQTAAYIAAECNLPVRPDPAWRERCFGELEGKTAGEIEIWRHAAGESDPPGAESASVFMDRIHASLVRLPLEPPGRGALAVVTHGGPCRGVLRMLISGRLSLAAGAAPPPLAMIANCSLFHLVWRPTAHGPTWEIAALNDVAHLHGLEATLADAG